MVRSNEPLVWAPFFAGAGIAALLMPVTLVITILASVGSIDESKLGSLLESPWVRLFLLVLISLSLFHATHRIRFILVDLGLKPAAQVIGYLCYGTAIVGTLLALWLVLPVWG
jgi:fumarate reductase subunit D